jgi:hypothetical protein
MTELERAISVAVREAKAHGATFVEIKELVRQLRQQATDAKADNERMTVPPDDDDLPPAA